MQINWMEEKIPEIRSVKVNDNFIAASFFEHSEICVWNAETKELVFLWYTVHILVWLLLRSFFLLFVVEVAVIDDCSLEEENSFCNYVTEGFCLSNNMLFTCHIKVSRLNFYSHLRLIDHLCFII